MCWRDQTWAGFHWHSWVPLSGLRWSDVPSEKGLYRIRSVSPQLLAYVGQGSLRDRIVGTWARASRLQRHEVSPSRNPKLHFLTGNRKRLGGYEAAWTQDSVDLSNEQIRKAHESRVLWRYRRETKQSSLANHGRASLALAAIDSNIDQSIRGKNPILPSKRPVEPAGRPAYSTRWMGLRWTNLISRKELKQGGPGDPDGFRLQWMQRGPVLYKALEPRLQLRKVGYKQNARSGALEVLRTLPEGTLVAWHNLSRLTPKHHGLELANDLVGAHFERSGRVPSCQF